MGAGLKEVEKFKTHWSTEKGVSNIPWSQIDGSLNLDELAAGGVLVEESLSQSIASDLLQKRQQKQKPEPPIVSDRPAPLPPMPLNFPPPPPRPPLPLTGIMPPLPGMMVGLHPLPLPPPPLHGLPLQVTPPLPPFGVHLPRPPIVTSSSNDRVGHVATLPHDGASNYGHRTGFNNWKQNSNAAYNDRRMDRGVQRGGQNDGWKFQNDRRNNNWNCNINSSNYNNNNNKSWGENNGQSRGRKNWGRDNSNWEVANDGTLDDGANNDWTDACWTEDVGNDATTAATTADVGGDDGWTETWGGEGEEDGEEQQQGDENYDDSAYIEEAYEEGDGEEEGDDGTAHVQYYDQGPYNRNNRFNNNYNNSYPNNNNNHNRGGGWRGRNFDNRNPRNRTNLPCSNNLNDEYNNSNAGFRRNHFGPRNSASYNKYRQSTWETDYGWSEFFEGDRLVVEKVNNFESVVTEDVNSERQTTDAPPPPPPPPAADSNKFVPIQRNVNQKPRKSRWNQDDGNDCQRTTAETLSQDVISIIAEARANDSLAATNVVAAAATATASNVEAANSDSNIVKCDIPIDPTKDVAIDLLAQRVGELCFPPLSLCGGLFRMLTRKWQRFNHVPSVFTRYVACSNAIFDATGNCIVHIDDLLVLPNGKTLGLRVDITELEYRRDPRHILRRITCVHVRNGGSKK
ncbi:hypothetical protein HELRODRAFT_191512 [Helobdella robusta]|uniref:Uncharacterized protein n=1 Tax=Helobdella robusta TaxID=6412 RepID=T1FT21_HELRO|nr:hypothetical protein HELRODRAFT_191512 [Helobdella robusta]ESO04929.1 hypothetical protein HELRODRAFT_191512 [Helobdella robusta]